MPTVEELQNLKLDVDKAAERQHKIFDFMDKVFSKLADVHDDMTPTEYDFFDKMYKAWCQYGIKTFMSEAQWRWLWRMAQKYHPEEFA